MIMNEDRKKQSPVGGGNTMSMKRKESNNVFDKLGFPSCMTFNFFSLLLPMLPIFLLDLVRLIANFLRPELS